MNENDEEVVLIQPQQQNKKDFMMKLILSLTLIIFTLISLILIIVTLKVTFDVEKAVNKETELIYQEESSFGIFTAGEVRDEGGRGTCWDFATMRFLEATYREEAHAKGFLEENEFIQFSEEAHGVNMINFCKENPNKCIDTPGAKNNATDGYPSWIYHFQSYLSDKLVVDLKTCPYTPNEGKDTECEGMQEFIDSKILKYDVNNYSVAYTVSEIKQELQTRKTPLPLVTELFWEKYHIPCEQDNTSSFGYSNEDCEKTSELCAPELQNEEFDRRCIRMDLMTSAEGEFLARRWRQEESLGAHAMLLVGYNDEYKMSRNREGGFIVENSWGPELSHSLDYLLGRISRRAEEERCPNWNSPVSWVPIRNEGEDKYKLRGVTILKYTSFVKPSHFHTTNTFQKTMDSIITALNTEYFAIDSIVYSVDNTVRVRLGYSNDTNTFLDPSKFDDSNTVLMPAMPLDFLSFLFSPINFENESANRKDVCGYYIIPYDFVDLVMENQGLWFVDAMTVEFSDSSFVKKGSKEKGAAEFFDALKSQDLSKPLSHTPWLIDEKDVPRFK